MTMLKKISISMLALCALSSSAFAQEADLPYTATADGQTLTFREVLPNTYYSYGNAATLNDLTISVQADKYIEFRITNSGTISGTSSITANGSPQINFTLTNNGTISGTLTLKGENGALPYLQVGAGTVFSAGTSIVLDGGVVTFDETDSVVWNVTEDTLDTALFSGSGYITQFSNLSLSLTLNFDSVDTMNKAASLKLFAEGASFTTADGTAVVADLDDVAIQIDGSDTGYTGSFSSEQGGFVIPEPSAFGLIAGAFALALAASRRRRNA